MRVPHEPDNPLGSTSNGKRKPLIGYRTILFIALAALIGAGAFVANIRRDADAAIVSKFPVPGSVAFPYSKVQVTFDRPIKPEPLTIRLQVQLADGSYEDVPAAVEIAKNHTSAVINPYRALPPGNVRVSVSAPSTQSSEWVFEVRASALEAQHADGNILLVLGAGSRFGPFYSEILEAEGFTNFSSIPGSALRSADLGAYQTLIVSGALDPSAATQIKKWVEGGGKLIAIRPTGALADLAGVTAREGSSSDDGDLIIDGSQLPGKGLVAEPIRFHGLSDTLSLRDGTKALASLSVGSGRSPALTIKSVGDKGGEVVAFAFDLAQSVVFTRQGNPEWAGQDRDGMAPIRSNDLFFGAAKFDPKPDYLDLSRVQIPQADEQMRLLSNLILFLGRDRIPLPRFWYFPKGAKAVLVMAADDHGTKDGTLRSFKQMLAADPPGCIVDQWECARATSWMFPSAKMTNGQALDLYKQGFDIGSHATTYCQNWSDASLAKTFATDLESFRIAFPALSPQEANRLHCIVWSTYVSQPKIGRGWGLRFDMNYYYWPKDWIRGRAGFMTGSGLPMRFFDLQGELIDVYQQETHLVDEVFFAHPEQVDALIARAVGPEGYYGAFGTHYDFHNAFDELLIRLAQKWRIPMVSAKQMLDWQDGRANSQIKVVGWDNGRLKLSISADQRTHGMLMTMLPLHSSFGELSAITSAGEEISFKTETLKGVAYALFPGRDGLYEAVYKPAAIRGRQ